MDEPNFHHPEDPQDGFHTAHHQDDPAGHFYHPVHDPMHPDTAHHGLFWTDVQGTTDGHDPFSVFGVPLQPLIDTILPHHGSLIDSIFHVPGIGHNALTPTDHHPDTMLGTIGHPEEDSAWWHLQQHDDTCAVVSQQFVLDGLTHGQMHLSEEQLQQEAIDHGWYIPGGGTPFSHVGDLLEYHGFEVHKAHGASLQQLADQLHQDHKVIVGVHAEDIWNSIHGSPDTPLADYPGIPGHHANHAVEVIGIEDQDPHHPVVILNDPGTPDGQALHVPADVFMNAWSASDNFMVNTTGATVPSGHAGEFSGLSFYA